MSEPENQTLTQLRELRADIKRLEARMEKCVARLNERLDLMQRDGVPASKGFIGHRVMVHRAFGSLDKDVKALPSHVDRLESAAS